MTVMLSGPEQKHVTMSWNPKEGIDVAPHVLSSLISRASSVQILATERLELTIAETNSTFPGVRAKQTLTVGLDGKLWATLILAIVP